MVQCYPMAVQTSEERKRALNHVLHQPFFAFSLRLFAHPFGCFRRNLLKRYAEHGSDAINNAFFFALFCCSPISHFVDQMACISSVAFSLPNITFSFYGTTYRNKRNKMRKKEAETKIQQSKVEQPLMINKYTRRQKSREQDKRTNCTDSNSSVN